VYEERKHDTITCTGGRTLDFRGKPLVMGIINCTPDSFYAGSRKHAVTAAVDTALRMETEGADILDIGGESSRPGADYVEEEEEKRRVLPVIREIRKKTDVLLSIDTRKRAVAGEALDAGADMVNDISALRDDPELARLVAERQVPVILMHMRGTPRDMQKNPSYENVVEEISSELLEWVENAACAGVPREKIILDPGIGFGKRYQDNLAIIKHLSAFKAMGFPLLIGLSRKSFIGAIIGSRDKPAPAEDRLAGTLAANTFCALKGADILRVHDVKATVDLVTVLDAIQVS
jgi:dihydropteroate synthase